MSCEPIRGGFICGNFAEVLPEKPKDYDYESSAKWLEPYPDDLERKTIGKTTCDCKQIETHYQPWYGFTWFHSNDCSLVQRVKKHPQLANLPAFDSVEIIGYSD